MIQIFMGLFSRQTATTPVTDGLPYWIFWLLISFILLLLAFIFLRDKELRRKMDEFFFLTRKRLIKLRHQRRMAREIRKKERLIMEIGQKAWDRRIEVKNGKKVFRDLKYLEEKSEKLQQENADIRNKIAFLDACLAENTKNVDARLSEKEEEKSPHVETLLDFKLKERDLEIEVAEKQKQLVTAVKNINSTRKELHENEEDGLEWGEEKKARAQTVQDDLDRMEKEKASLDDSIKGLVEKKDEYEREQRAHEKSIEEIEKEIIKIEHDGKHQSREYQKEIKEWEKNQTKVADKIQKLAKEREPLFEEYGGLVEAERVNDKELQSLYSQIDRVMARIAEIEKQIEALE